MGKVKMTITCDEDQVQLIQDALEEYMRLRIGQCYELADDLAKINEAHGDRAEFDRRINLRNYVKDTIECTIRHATFVTGMQSKMPENALNASDLYYGIRHEAFEKLRSEEDKEALKYTTLADKPLYRGEYPPAEIRIERIE